MIISIDHCHYSVTNLCPTFFATPWTLAYQASPSIGFPRQEYRRVLPFPSPGDCPNPGIKPAFPVLAGEFFTTEPPGKPQLFIIKT